MGWAFLQDGKYSGSGIQSVPKLDNEAYQQYRMRLITYWAIKASKMLRSTKPDVVVSEIVPVKGFSDPSQAFLAASAISAVQTIVALRNIPNVVVAASSVKVTLYGSSKATKVQVRNSVIQRFPELENRRKEWSKVFDESDAIAIALHFLEKNA